jgi:hypothetical protein
LSRAFGNRKDIGGQGFVDLCHAASEGF